MGSILQCIPSLGAGGAERQLAMLAAALAGRGWNIHLAYLHGGAHEQALSDAGVTMHSLGKRGSFSPGTPLALRKLIKSVGPQVVQSWLLMMDVHAGLVTPERIPWILSERSSAIMYERKHPFHTPVRFWLRRRLARRAAAVIANSRGGAEYWAKHLPGRVRQIVIPNAVPIEDIEACPDTPERFDELAAGRDVVLYVGRLWWEKNLPVLSEALRDVLQSRPNAVAVLCGDGHLAAETKQRFVDYGLADRAHFLGSVASAEAHAWMKRARVTVSASLFEGHPNAVLEAMTLRCPLVVSDIPAHRDVLPDDAALFADGPSEIAEAIRRTLDDRPAAETRSAIARQRVEEFTVRTMVDRYEAAYLEVMR